MTTRCIQRTIRNTFHRWPAKLVLLGYVWICCGGTLPATLWMSSATAKMVQDKDRSVPFPCQDKPCGCRNAEQCYKSCCCSSKAERIAWAKEHAVSAKYLELAAEAAEEPTPAKNCCAHKTTSACCQPAQQTSSCCKPANSHQQPRQQRPDPSPSKQRPAPGFSMLSALKCAGLQVGALSVPLSLPPSWELPLRLEAPWIGWVEERNPIFSSLVITPDGPPPRF